MEPRVRLPQGTYVGRRHLPTATRPRALDVFLGIPYALSTGGRDRFRPARAVPERGGEEDKEFNSAVLGPISPYTNAAGEPLASGEDCLSVNIVFPSPESGGMDGNAAREGKLPVVVYFHGGAFNMGFGADRDMLSFVAHSRRDVVAVSFNYRLGALGFLPSASVVGEEGRGALNLGLGDQKAAMAWVARNIGAFGGDVGRVGVIGISAGAHSIGHHLLSESPPFSKAILESGAPTSRAVLHPHHPRHESHFSEFLSALDIPTSDPAPLSRLRDVPLAKLTAAAQEVWETNAAAVTWPFQPVIDGPGGHIERSPLALLKEGRGRGVPLITGFCTHEGTAFVPRANDASSFRSFFQVLIPGLSATDMDVLEGLYPLSEYADPPPEGMGAHWRRLEAAYAHYAYIAPVLQTAAFLAPHAPVYVYEFAVPGGPLRTANHTDQTPYVTRSLEGAGMGHHEGLGAVSRAMHGFFSEFLAGEEALEGWPRFISPDEGGGDGLEAAKIMVFGRGNTELVGGEERGVAYEVRTLGAREMERIRFWWEKTILSQGMGDGI
ncbi:related to cholinesterase [Cephalotrichum gorgonifer]|uniref:Carboxylic ester hydrolase n=1 Tax=Cephalotrichum gorgonifer TaxID=2041049 RepID=A0AAE8N2S6_9PEZI|nr:related to cholinesterase [Cephalotrichum gorgonifer]